MKNIYFIDFDGTISLVDTCYAMVARFAGPGWEDWENRWLKGEITTKECARGIFHLFHTTEKALTDFILSLDIDSSFPAFVHWCRGRGESLYILSDGYDLNIRLLLAKYGLDDLPYFANRLRYTDNRFSIETPYHNPQCGRCGTCKRTIIRRLTREGWRTVYVGDGHSDKCAAREADVVFAKNSLLVYCGEQNIPCVPFQDFTHIMRYLSPHPDCREELWRR